MNNYANGMPGINHERKPGVYYSEELNEIILYEYLPHSKRYPWGSDRYTYVDKHKGITCFYVAGGYGSPSPIWERIGDI